MKILMTNHHLNVLQGSETATYTLATALRRAGHDVQLLTLESGHMTEVLKNEKFEITMDLKSWKDQQFDVAHCHHWPMAVLVRNTFPDLPIVYLSHGVIPDLEKPPSKKVGVAVYAGVSEEVCNMLLRAGVKDSVIMRNAVDCERFRPFDDIGEKPQRVMALSNHFSGCDKTMSGACKKLGFEYWVVGQEVTSVWDTETTINKADMIISLGRGCIESMACGRAVIVYDMHGGDGMMTSETWEHSRRRNFSGRKFKLGYDVKKMIREIYKYSSLMGSANRSYVLKHHNVDVEVRKWKELYVRAIEIGVLS